MFPRGKGPLVSILLPSRGRTESLKTVLDALYSFSVDSNDIECLLKIDSDDEETIRMVRRIKTIVPGMKVMISPRGNGYPDLHIWVNELCARSTGDWLFLIDDNQVMLHEGWDSHLKNCILNFPWFGCWDICGLFACLEGEEGKGTKNVPVIRRKVYEILGHLSLSHHVDSWISGVLDCLHATVTDVDFLKIRHSVPRDETSKSKNSHPSHALGSYPTIYSLEAKEAIFQDARKLLDYLKNLNLTSLWTYIPDRPGWYFWCYDGGLGRSVYVDKELLPNMYLDGKLQRVEMPEGGKYLLVVKHEENQ